MPKRLLPLFLFVGLMLACCPLIIPFTTPTPTNTPPTPIITDTPVPPPPISQTDAPFNIAWDDRALFRRNLTVSAQSILEGLPGASIYHIAFSISDPPTRVGGVEEVRYTNQETVALTEVDFAVFPEILGGSIVINNLSLDGQPVAPTHQTGLMRVPLAAPLQPGESVIIHVEFEVTVPALGGDFYYGIFGYNDGILSLAHAYPTILVYNEQGWNNQTPDLDGDPLFSDTSFYLVAVEAPADLVLVASGTEVERSETAGRQRVLYADGPARDFYLAASRDLVKSSDTVDGTTVNSYTLVGEEEFGQAALGVGLAAIELFNNQYGPYPYTEFDLSPIQTSAGGVEYPGMTVIMLDAYTPNSANFLELIVVHEIAHQWFYNLVGNDNQTQPWLDESLAEFLTWEYYRLQYGAERAAAYEAEEQGWCMSASGEEIPIGLPVSAYASSDYGAVVYGCGPFFFDALRDRMGQDAFNQMMQNYVAAYAWEIATADGFKAIAEQHCNCDLTPLFDEWVYP